MGKHTPGPWNVSESGYHVYYVNPKIESGELDESFNDPSHDSIVAATDDEGSYSGIPDDDRLANARLIAAAPDLLECVKEAVRLFESYGIVAQPPAPCGKWINDCRDAIAKAEGKPVE